jgi:hypothetical protein
MENNEQISRVSVGPVSKEIIDAAIEYANDRNCTVTLIPSRRQVDWNGGYVGFTTMELSRYCKDRSQHIKIQRDHGGPQQGEVDDVGFDSFYWDAKGFDSIHIDPFRLKNFSRAVYATVGYIDFCLKVNPKVEFEIGTEESIFPYSPHELGVMLQHLKDKLTPLGWERIRTVCIQCGTALSGNDNVGKYNSEKLSSMVAVCKRFGKSSKEHNGDYVSSKIIHGKFNNGLDLVNIAPEFGKIQTDIYLERFSSDQFDKWFEIAYNSMKWKKWVAADFNPFESNGSRIKLIRICGHYTFNLEKFKQLKISAGNIDEELKKRLTDRLDSINMG